MPPITRFAPSPTGYLHLGHAYAALQAWRAARAAGGRFLLRLEDIDTARCRPQYAAAIVEDLQWLGLDWDGPVRVQSAHFAQYQAVLQTLRERGLVYPCFCSRADILRESAAAAGAPQGAMPGHATPYPGLCRGLPPGRVAALLATGAPHAWRLDMARAIAAMPALPAVREAGQPDQPCNPAGFGDVVLARRDAPASYHLCVTHDDAAQGITLVARGEDLRPAAHLHVLLQALLGWPVPDYAHHRLICDAQGRRLAKRDGAPSLRSLRAAGHSPAELRDMACACAVAPNASPD